MEISKNQVTVVFFLAVSLLMDTIFAQDRIEMNCNPSIKHRFDVCPDTYCCVRDEFLPTYVYCRKIGLEDENCATRDNDSECPCAPGLYCKPNIVSSFQSLYGRCYNATKDATTTSTTTTPTTPTSTITTTTNMESSPSNQTNNPTNSSMNSTMKTDTDNSIKKPLLPFQVPVVG